MKTIGLLGLIFIVPAICFAEQLASDTEVSTDSLPVYQEAKDFFVIKDQAEAKYECKCFVWSKKGKYRVVDSFINHEGTVTNLLEDIENGGTVANFRWNKRENRIEMDDIPWQEKKAECFDPSSVVEIRKELGDQVLAMGHDTEGRDISVWVKKDDLIKIDPATPDYESRRRHPRIEHNQCNF